MCAICTSSFFVGRLFYYMCLYHIAISVTYTQFNFNSTCRHSHIHTNTSTCTICIIRIYTGFSPILHTMHWKHPSSLMAAYGSAGNWIVIRSNNKPQFKNSTEDNVFHRINKREREIECVWVWFSHLFMQKMNELYALFSHTLNRTWCQFLSCGYDSCSIDMYVCVLGAAVFAFGILLLWQRFVITFVLDNLILLNVYAQLTVDCCAMCTNTCKTRYAKNVYFK